jgi:O-antigen/teichoic acid export membrane protein
MKISIIRKKEVTERDYTTVFFANILMSCLLYVIIFFLAPYIADFYKKPQLVSIMRVFSITIIIQAFVFVQSAILTKNLNFRQQTLMKLPSIILSSAIGISLALLHYGVWSLVWMYLTQTFFWALFHWIFSEWKPKWIFDKALFKFHFDFGYKLTIVEILNSVTANIYQIIIGKFYAIKDVGYYTQSLTVRQLPISNIYGAVSKLLLPIFSKVQDDPVRLTTIYKKILSIILVIITPILIYIAFFSEEIIVFLYSEKWKLAAPFLFYLSIAGVFNVIYTFNSSVLSIVGDSKLILKIEILNKLQRFIFIIISLILMLSIKSFLLVILISTIVNYFIVNHYTSKILKISNLELMLVFSHIGLIAFLSTFSSYFIFNFFRFNSNTFLICLTSILFGLMVYVSLLYIFKRVVIISLLDFFKTLKPIS